MNCRRYRLDQVANFRDLGGYACDGGVTRYGVIFRSTALNKATEEDIAKICLLYTSPSPRDTR